MGVWNLTSETKVSFVAFFQSFAPNKQTNQAVRWDNCRRKLPNSSLETLSSTKKKFGRIIDRHTDNTTGYISPTSTNTAG